MAKGHAAIVNQLRPIYDKDTICVDEKEMRIRTKIGSVEALANHFYKLGKKSHNKIGMSQLIHHAVKDIENPTSEDVRVNETNILSLFDSDVAPQV